jgi:hypothetical protein
MDRVTDAFIRVAFAKRGITNVDLTLLIGRMCLSFPSRGRLECCGEPGDLLRPAEPREVAAVTYYSTSGFEVGQKVRRPCCVGWGGAEGFVDHGWLLGVKTEFPGEAERDGHCGLIT